MKVSIFIVAVMLSWMGHATAATTPPTTCGSGKTISLPFVVWTNDAACPSGYAAVSYNMGTILGIDVGTTYQDNTGTFTVSAFCPYTE